MIQSFLIKILVSPISVIYGISIWFRNLSYDLGIVKTSQFNIPVIGIGNLSMGGAGKTPHIEYLIRLLSPYLSVATLSRGYKRKTVGFLIVGAQDSALTVGDEPFMYHLKHKNITVSVAESRSLGIPQLLSANPDIKTILLDDHFQHRSVQAGLSILLTDYSNPYDKDFLLPVGQLREWPMAAKRADIIIVTKCPPALDISEQKAWKHRLKVTQNQQIHFSYYHYLEPYSILTGERRNISSFDNVLLLSSIANVAYLHSYLVSKVNKVELATYEDHHLYTPHEVSILNLRLQQLSGNAAIISTEKDATRLMLHKDYIVAQQLNIFLLPIEVRFVQNAESFDDKVKDFLLNFKV